MVQLLKSVGTRPSPSPAKKPRREIKDAPKAPSTEIHRSLVGASSLRRRGCAVNLPLNGPWVCRPPLPAELFLPRLHGPEPLLEEIVPLDPFHPDPLVKTGRAGRVLRVYPQGDAGLPPFAKDTECPEKEGPPDASPPPLRADSQLPNPSQVPKLVGEDRPGHLGSIPGNEP